MRHAAHADLGLRLTGRAEGVPLRPLGRFQAALLARRLAAEGPDAVRTSPRERARETAQAIAQAAGLTPTVDPRLDEIEFGAWTGRSFESLAGDPDWEAWNARRGSARPPGGESMAEAVARIAALAADLAEEEAGGGARRIVLVTHADMIRGLVAHVLGLPLDNLLRLEVGPASVTRIEAGPGWARLTGLNDLPRERAGERRDRAA
ncbi:histidine phosphatase family protein [Rubellimicrobium sp. CFH 75288]|uniref:histidine phosphatase family protein n=1 Tax=Rubellimicrobium sp. CFH 75288 TaxID=2697034 RepID=UPI001412B5C2|nr:histidine phosphatase family protein [Rubellimicrobium sp. CFH 75288]